MARIAALPDVPTTTEAGFKDSDTAAWVGLLAPAATPRQIVERLAAEVAKALKEPKVADKLTPNGMLITSVSLKAFDAQIAQEIRNNAAIAKALGLKPQ